MKAMILVLENNIQAADLIVFALSRVGYYIIRADNGKDGMRLIRTRKPDIVLVDLPEGMDPDSFDICTQIKEEGLDASPIMFASEDEIDLAISLKIEHIVKPFPIRTLLERINLIALRTEQIQKPMIQTLGRITIDSRKAVISKDGIPLDISLMDYELFCYFASQPGKVFTREELLKDVWGYTGYLGGTRIVDVAIRRLRMRIEDDPSHPTFILTRRRVGYLIDVPEKNQIDKDCIR